MSTAVVFDTLKFVRRLREAGVDERQAEALSDAFKEVQDAQLALLATKADLRDLEYRLAVRLGGILIAGFVVLAVIL
ncbi:MAG: CCDC90 family protein [Magnetococcus sp. YQC-9]